MKGSGERLEALLERVLKKVRPTAEELLEEGKVSQELVSKIRQIEGKHVEVILAGSVARDTHIRGDRDIDVFVMFPKKMEREEFIEEGLKIGKKALRGFEWKEAYSQHPYIRGSFKGFEVEIVPSFQIDDTLELKSAVDRTPFHTKYLEENLREEQKDEVRLLKQFLKGIKCYGADLKTESFPGYITELLIVNYGTFLNTLRNVSRWKKGTVIDLKKFYSAEDARKRFSHHLTIVDPTDKRRNVAAALSLNQFSRFVAAAGRFLGKPSEKFFFGKRVKPWRLERVRRALRKKEIVCVEMPFPGKALPDIMWGMLKRLGRKMEKELQLKEFRVYRAREWSDEEKLMAVVFDLENVIIQRIHKRVGPEVTDFENAERFFKAHKRVAAGPRVENGRWVIEVERKYFNAVTLLKDFLGREGRQAKKGIKKSLQNAKVLKEKQVLQLYRKNKGFAEFFTTYLRGGEEFLD